MSLLWTSLSELPTGDLSQHTDHMLSEVLAAGFVAVYLYGAWANSDLYVDNEFTFFFFLLSA